MKKNQNFVDAFNQLGESFNIDTNDTVIATLEKYTCVIYGYPREASVNAVRTKLFERKYAKEDKVINMSLLPPCNSVLILHIKRANCVAKMWKSSLTNWFDPDDISENGWLPDGLTYWVDDIFPRNVEEILCDPSFINDDFDEFDEQDQLSEDSDKDYDDDNDK